MVNQLDGNSMIRLGPRLSLIVGGILIVQTILNDPSTDFREEIAAQLQFTMPGTTKTKTSNRAAYFDRSDQRFLTTAERERGHHLFRPSIWPYGVAKEDPVESSVKGGNGTRYPGESVVLTNYEESALVPLTEFMSIDDEQQTVVPFTTASNADGRRSYATCRFMDYQYSFYFPHFVQQLFRCWSFWRAHPHKIPVFVTGKSEYHWKLAMDKKFNRGIMAAIQHAGVQVVNSESVSSSPIISSAKERSISAISKGPILHPTGNHYQVRSTEDMTSFRGEVLASLNLTKAIPSSFCSHSSNFPRIGILSRRKSRRIKNVKGVAQQLKEHYNLNYNIPVIYFEQAPFLNQVGMMASIDILITPHGAQETGIAFMPRCGGVLELLPDKYFFPRFYGTLATTAGLEHAYIYLAKNVSDHSVDVLQRDIGFMQPSMDRIQEGVDLLVDRWRHCCVEADNRKQNTINFLASIQGDSIDSQTTPDEVPLKKSKPKTLLKKAKTILKRKKKKVPKKTTTKKKTLLKPKKKTILKPKKTTTNKKR